MLWVAAITAVKRLNYLFAVNFAVSISALSTDFLKTIIVLNLNHTKKEIKSDGKELLFQLSTKKEAKEIPYKRYNLLEKIKYWLKRKEHNAYNYEGRLNYLITTILLFLASKALFWSSSELL